MKLIDIIRIKFPEARIINDYVISDIGKGQYISYWNEDTLGVIPTKKDIVGWGTDLQLQYEYALAVCRDSRARAYPSISDQLDMQWHDKQNNTNTWDEAIEAVKQQFPKPLPPEGEL